MGSSAESGCKGVLKAIERIEVELREDLLVNDLAIKVINLIKKECKEIIECDKGGWY